MFASLAAAMAFDEEQQSAGGQLASPLLLLLRELLPSLLFLANCGSEDEVMAEVRVAGRGHGGGVAGSEVMAVVRVVGSEVTVRDERLSHRKTFIEGR